MLIFWNCGFSQQTSPLHPEKLRCEYLRDPVGIDVIKPRLSWVLTNPDLATREQTQRGFQIVVASRAERLQQNEGDLWDSGRVRSSDSIHVPYGGKPLGSGAECFWKVRVWDEAEKVSNWSEPAKWSMGLLQPSDWRAKWVGLDGSSNQTPLAERFAGAAWIWFAEGEPRTTAPLGARFFRRKFEIPMGKAVKNAGLYFTADDRATVFINGQRVGSCDNFRLLSAEDVGGSLHAGQNLIAVRAENQNPDADPNPAGLFVHLSVEFADGSGAATGTDQSWRVSKAEIPGWKDLEFDDADWTPARIAGRIGDEPWALFELPEDRALPARMVRREFALEKKISSATAYFSGLGLSEFYLNGEKIGDQVLSPGLTDYSKRVLYRTYDVTHQIRTGTNCAAVVLGNGRFFAPRLRVPTETISYGFPRMLLQIKIRFQDGTSSELISDGSWRVTDQGPIRANNEYDGETYDARQELSGWNQAGFDDSGWRSAQLVDPPRGRLAAEMLEPTRITQSLQPREITEPKPGTFVFDFGQTLAGWCRLQVQGAGGTKISLKHAERLNQDGTVNTENLRSAKGTDIYILKGGGPETYEPRFTYHGFRYVQVEGLSEKPKAASLTARVVHDDLEPAGTFECSNDVLNGVYSNIVWTLRAGYRSIPTDCPNRDERQGWLGDRNEECRGESYVFNIAALYRKWLVDIADAQKENGSIPDVCPPYWPIYADDVVWPSGMVMIPGMLQQQYGDNDAIRLHYGAMRKWVDHMLTFVTNGITWKDAYKDWCPPPENPKLIITDDPTRRTTKPLLATAHLYYDLKLLTAYARQLGESADARRFERAASDLKTGFNRTFLNKSAHRYANGTQTSSILPLAFGLVPNRERPKLFQSLVENIVWENQRHIATGTVGIQWLMRVLSDNGRPDLAYCLANQTTYPSWGYMLENGATTLWELWNGNTAQQEMSSANHPMLIGDLTTWFYEYLAGIRPDPADSGFRHFILNCEPVEGLHFVKAKHESPYGTITSEWERRDTHFRWRVTVPVNTTATMLFPCGNPRAVRESGQSAAKARGVNFLRVQAGRSVFSLASGIYCFES